MELYVCPGGEHGDGDHPGRVFLCRPGVDNNVAECFETDGISAQQAGERIANSVNVVTRIVEALNREPEWDSDTMSEVANILHEEGFKLRDPDEGDGFEEAMGEVIRATKQHKPEGGDGE